MATVPKLVEKLRGKMNLRAVFLIRGDIAFKGVRPGDELRGVMFGIQTAGRRSPDQRNVLQVLVGMKIVGKPDESDRDIVEIACEHTLDYEVSDEKLLDDVTDDDFAEFAKLNGVYNAWPFIREFLVNVSSRMPLPNRLVLPTLIPEMMEAVEQRKWGDFGLTSAKPPPG